ncbi:hypothetical protein AX14_012531 [Amanita brunnescens Koide BX004]|nr:hypothetical protein AX14_012531 [Amanita brunnescens Koide BX004]
METRSKRFVEIDKTSDLEDDSESENTLLRCFEPSASPPRQRLWPPSGRQPPPSRLRKTTQAPHRSTSRQPSNTVTAAHEPAPNKKGNPRQILPDDGAADALADNLIPADENDML